MSAFGGSGGTALLGPLAARCSAPIRLAGERLTVSADTGEIVERFGSVDGIVIGHRHQVHAEPFQFVVYGQRIVVAFPANPAQNRDSAHARVTRVNVQIAPHTSYVELNRLQLGDTADKHL